MTALDKVIEYALFFFMYSALGWAMECIYCYVMDKKWTNRGFLFGPLCPIYGTGAITMLVTLSWCKHMPWVLIPLGMIVSDIVEYITSFVMEKLFHARWWDYSNQPYNLNGRICLRHTIYWGIISVVFMYVVDPFFGQKIMGLIDPKYRIYILGVILVIFTVDLIVAVKNAIDIRNIMDKIKKFSENIKKYRESVAESWNITGDKWNTFKKEFGEQFQELKNYFENKQNKKNNGTTRSNRLFRGYKALRNKGEESLSEIETIGKEIKSHVEDDKSK